jgi:hypothetical protein
MCRISFDDSPAKVTVTTVTNNFVQRGSIGLPYPHCANLGMTGIARAETLG